MSQLIVAARNPKNGYSGRTIARMMPKMKSGPTRPLRKPKALRTYLLTRPPKPEVGFPGRLLERSEEHTAELKSLMRTSNDVCCLKKKKKINRHKQHTIRENKMNTTT